MSEYLLEMNGISKSFPGVKALDHVTLKVRPGTVHALVGENGAGKSTLMKCLFGIYSKDEGEIIIEGKPIHIANPYDALTKGIAMVHQELQPIMERSVAENIYCGRFPLKHGLFIDHKRMYEDTERLLKEVKMNFDPKVKLSTLSVSQMQAIEIAKAVSANAKIIIMDEPTSSLTQNEVDNLFEIINSLRKKGISIIYISHKMDEILSISDDVTIMRDGQYIGTWEAKELTIDMIVTKMVGRELKNLYPPKSNIPEEVVLEVKGLTSISEKSFKDVSFQLRKGEVLGIGGLVGAQRSELFEAVFGIRGIKKGTITYKGKELKIKRPHDAIKQGIALLTEDRRATGIFGVLSIAENISVASLDKYVKLGFLNERKVENLVQENVKKLSIKTPSSKTKIQTLSGGNQQKVIISRWLANDPDIFILDEPTRGIDVGAKYEIYTIIADLAKQGKSIIMISSELPELIGMSDRVLVMCNGKVSGEVSKEDATQENIMSLATKFA
ncbi:galactose/methyl galactoside ABC transporter ATP-binding protein MglA [Anaerocolumna aminovalerica]|uniref:Ribose/galactose/methyl galactoside import ATP-binding protein n=1 Tax=Anaerocolumna aminovalerica TaxID=1527 RepID=A0A1I5EXA9_9FIRM|nr:sugar ABC transporter ATP-binding protein [Anaerocolumna aminovalerica]MDU6266228.1 sugar ABC transporter ATP-binding protein [Anaerocolumna aminovalerica]SFO16030.1 methyl-galactoside transport system ATP-binding protein [Anaerocolumna aminovalerica]